MDGRKRQHYASHPCWLRPSKQTLRFLLWRHVMWRAEWMTGRVLHLQKAWKFPGRNICGRAAGHCPSGCELWAAVHKDADVLSVELPVFETAESLLPSTPPALLIHQNLFRHPLHRPSNPPKSLSTSTPPALLIHQNLFRHPATRIFCHTKKAAPHLW